MAKVGELGSTFPTAPDDLADHEIKTQKGYKRVGVGKGRNRADGGGVGPFLNISLDRKVYLNITVRSPFVRRGVSPVITSTLLVLVSIAVVSIFYTWATASTTQVSGALYTDAQTAEKRILSSVRILTPPPQNPWDTNQPVFIHNNGAIPITNLRVYITPPGSTTLQSPEAIYVNTDGNVSTIPSNGWPLKAFYPGDVLVVWLPSDNYAGYTITVLGDNFEESRTVGAAT